MGKNIMVLGMSTLSLNRKDKAVPEARVSRFCWKPGDETGEEYFSQLEPASRMILEREKSLDQVIIFATPETKNPVKFVYQGEEIEISAVDFYLKRLGITDPNKVAILEVSDENFTHAIYESVEIIRNFWKKYENAEPKLWIDTQGGFRNTNLVVNAIMSLLKSDDIVPSGIYSIKYSEDNRKPNPIQNQTNTYKIFDFVSGVNEFSRYGRAEQLEDYYKGIAREKVPEVIEKMKTIAEDIQMCDMISFDEDLVALRKLIRTKKVTQDDLLNIFWTQIENDYGNLLKDSCTGLDIVEWLYKKKFYQQAITYIEAKMPGEWVERKIIKYTTTSSRGADVLEILKESLKKSFEKNDNLVISQIGFECFSWRAIVDTDRNGKLKQLHKFESAQSLSNGRKPIYKNGFSRNQVPVKIKERGGWVTIGHINLVIDRKKQGNIMDLILLYKLLKNERNNFNHMSEKSARADQKTLGDAIHLFIEVGRKVYEG